MDVSHRLKGVVVLLNRVNDPIVPGTPAEVGLSAAAADDKSHRQIDFREVNEHIAELSVDWSEPGVSLFVCECSDPSCAEALEITPAEYEQVRADGARFIVLASHQLPEVERVVGGNDRFLVVEKLGAAAEVARASDPRQHA